MSRGGLEKSKERGRKKTRERLKYQQTLNLMQTQTETQKAAENTTEEICARVIGTELPAEFNGFAKRIVDAIAYAVNRVYNPYVVACIKGNTLTVFIRNQYIEHIYTCAFACEFAVETLNCNREGYIKTCFKKCMKRIREESSRALYDSIKNIEAELVLLGAKYTYQVNNEKPPQEVKFTIYF